MRCSYCQNDSIQIGRDYRDTGEIVELIRSSTPFVSGVVFSGGEPTAQKDALLTLARESKKLGLAVCVQTNGFFPNVSHTLLSENLIDKVALDYKTLWEGYSERSNADCDVPCENYQKNIRASIRICKEAFEQKTLKEFEVIATIFHGNESDIKEIVSEISSVDLVIQQGEYKLGFVREIPDDISENAYINRKRAFQRNHPPLSLLEIKKIADDLGKTVRIRTREIGEILYEGNRSCRPARKRKR